MADYAIPKNGAAFIFYGCLVSQADTKLFKSAPTLAAGDFKVSIDGGAFANLATLPTNTPGTFSVKFSLSGAEMTGDNILVVASDAAGAEWCDQCWNIQTSARGVADLAYPATSGRSMVVDASGLVDANTVKIGPTGSGTAQTARDIGASVLLSSGTGTGQLDFTSGVVKANVTQLLGTAWLTPGTAGTPDVNVKLWNGLATVALPLVPTTAGRTLDVSVGGEAGVDWANVGSPTTSLALTGTTIATTQKVDIETIKTNPVVNAGTVTFPTTATLASTTNITAGTVTTATNVTTVNGLASGVITATSIAADAITAAKIATGAIDADALATDAVTEIWAGSTAPTAAAIATAVWQDSTAGDFTTASSIGKALYIANIAPGGSGGHMISGSNSGTTTLGALTVTGATTLTGAVTGTNASNDLRVNTIAIGGSTTPVTNIGIVFNTDFATNYNTTLDMWNVNTTYWGGVVTSIAEVNADVTLIAGNSVQNSGTVDFDLIANLNATISSRMATYTQPTGFLAATFPTTVASTTNITAASGVRLSATGVDDIWDEVQSGHTTAGTFGKYLDAQVSTVGGGTAASIADAVWDEVLSGHLTSGTTGAALNAAGSAGDPWTTTLPGSYTGSSAGFKFGTLFATALNILHPYVGQDSSLELVIGDDYYAADNRNIQFTYGASPSLSGATVYLDIQTDTGEAFDEDNRTVTTGSASGTTTQLVTFDLPGTTTTSFDEGWRAYRVRAVLSGGHTVTLTRGRVNMLSRGNDAP